MVISLIDFDEERWRLDAACEGYDTNMWFPEDGAIDLRAIEICQSCAVQVDCLAYAIRNQVDWGIWGGVTETRRKRARRRRAIFDAAIELKNRRRATHLRLAADRRDVYLGDDDSVGPLETLLSEMGRKGSRTVCGGRPRHDQQAM